MGPTTMSGFWCRSQSISEGPSQHKGSQINALPHTLFAGLVFNFSKIFWDWVFVARLIVPFAFRLMDSV